MAINTEPKRSHDTMYFGGGGGGSTLGVAGPSIGRLIGGVPQRVARGIIYPGGLRERMCTVVGT